jgi:hypothetical protein
MNLSLSFALAILSLLSIGATQTTIPCLQKSGLTSLPACDGVTALLTKCNGTNTDQEYADCLCIQPFFNDIVEYDISTIFEYII